MATGIRFIFLCLFAFMAPLAHASFSSIADLCAAGGIDGSYTAITGGNFVRLNIVCLGQDTIVGMLTNHTGPSESGVVFQRVSFDFSLIDDGRLVLSTTPMDPDDRPTIPSNAAFTWIAIDLASITTSGFPGGVETLNAPAEVTIAFKRDASMTFPQLQPAAGGPFPEDQMRGSYRVSNSKFGPMTVEFDVFDTVPYIAISIPKQGDVSTHTVYGPPYDPSTGLIASAGVTGEYSLDATPIYCLIGQFVSESSLSFYLIDGDGVYGPYIGTRAPGAPPPP